MILTLYMGGVTLLKLSYYVALLDLQRKPSILCMLPKETYIILFEDKTGILLAKFLFQNKIVGLLDL